MNKEYELYPSPALLFTRFLKQHPSIDLNQFDDQALVAIYDTSCVCCSSPIAKGEKAHDGFLGPSFQDASFFNPPDAKRGIFCTHCRMALSLPMASNQFSYVQLGHDRINNVLKAYKIFGLEDFLAAVYTPLASPMVMVRKDKKKQHTLWKGKINIHDVPDEDTLIFNVGDLTLIGHPQRVLKLAQKEQQLIALAQESGKANKKAKPLKEVFQLRALKINLNCPVLQAINYKSDYYSLGSAELIGRLDRFVQIMHESSLGDKVIYAHLRLLGAFKKTNDYAQLIKTLEPTEVDMNAILSNQTDT